MDWTTRKILGHRVAVRLEAMHSVEVLEEAFTLWAPDIANANQGSPFTANALTKAVLFSYRG